MPQNKKFDKIIKRRKASLLYWEKCDGEVDMVSPEGGYRVSKLPSRRESK
jgi:hypothetical protein